MSMDWQKAPRSSALLVLLASVGCVSGETQQERGEALYSYCEHCHGAAGEGNPDFRVPAIAGFDQWYVEAQLHKFRIGARGDHPLDTDGLRMRPMSRALANDTEVTEVAAYVASLSPVDPPDEMTGGDSSAGQRLFTQPIDGSQPCVDCHGANGQGNRDMNAPSLHNESDWYLVAQLHKFREGIRGTDTLDVSGITMRPQALALPNEQAILDVVAYIETLDD
jgi:cytochrome c oxidase subunit 2